MPATALSSFRFLALVLLLAAVAAPAQAHSRHHGHRRHGHSSLHFGLHFGYPPWGPYPYAPYGYVYGYPPYGWGPLPVAPPNVGFVDLDVAPEEAEVYIGGKLVGIADDFDGYPGLLTLRPGTRVVTLRHPGYRDLKLRLGVQAGHEIHIERRMSQAVSGRP